MTTYWQPQVKCCVRVAPVDAQLDKDAGDGQEQEDDRPDGIALLHGANGRRVALSSLQAREEEDIVYSACFIDPFQIVFC